MTSRAHWACTILAIIVAIVAVVNSTNMNKRVALLEQKLSAKADTTMVNTKLDALAGLHQEDMKYVNQRLGAAEDSIQSVKDYAEVVHKGLDDLDANVMGLRKRLGFVPLNPQSSIPKEVINQLGRDLTEVAQAVESIQRDWLLEQEDARSHPDTIIVEPAVPEKP